MKKKLLLGSLLAIAAIAVLAVAPFVLSYQSTQAHVATTNTYDTNFRVFEHSTNSKTITVGTKHDPRGNYYVFDDTVFNASDSHQIGFSEGLCTYTSKTITQCDWTLILPGGNITISGAAPESDVVTTYAVTGGTGVYSQARGEAVLKYLKIGSQEEYQYDFYL